MWKRSIAVFAVLVLASPAWPADADWVARRVVPRKPGVKLGAKDGPKDKAPVYTVFVVRADEGGQLHLKTRLDDGWGAKADWMLLEDAAAVCTERIKANPKDDWAFGIRAVARELAWDRFGALADYSESIRLEADAYTLFLRAGLHYTMNDNAKAETDLAEAIRLDPNRPIFHSLLSDVQYQSGDSGLAAKTLDAAIKKFPKNADLVDSRAWLEFAANRHDEAIRFYDASIALDKNYSWPHFGKARSLAAKGEDAKALEEFELALKADPRCFETRRARAAYWQSKNDDTRAETDLTDAIRVNKTYPDLWMERAALRSAFKHYDKAVEDYSEVIRMIPLHADALVNRGIAHIEAGKRDLAMADFNSALKLDPKNIMALNQRAFVHSLQKNHAEAAKDFETALRLEPDNWITLDAFAWVLSTCPDAKFRDGKRALELAGKSCKAQMWGNPRSIEVLGAACAETGDFANAIKQQKKALEEKWWADLHGEACRLRIGLYEMKKPYRE